MLHNSTDTAQTGEKHEVFHSECMLCTRFSAKITTKLRKKNDEQFILKKIAHRI